MTAHSFVSVIVSYQNNIIVNTTIVYVRSPKPTGYGNLMDNANI